MKYFIVGTFSILAFFFFMFAFGLTANGKWTFGLIDMVLCAMCFGATLMFGLRK